MFSRRRAVPQEGEVRAQRALDRAEAVLQSYRRNGLTVVSIEDVLDLLGSEPSPPAAPRTVPADPRADPLTGALWPGPPGSRPPG